jgi:hypothetical protein
MAGPAGGGHREVRRQPAKAGQSVPAASPAATGATAPSVAGQSFSAQKRTPADGTSAPITETEGFVRRGPGRLTML